MPGLKHPQNRLYGAENGNEKPLWRVGLSDCGSVLRSSQLVVSKPAVARVSAPPVLNAAAQINSAVRIPLAAHPPSNMKLDLKSIGITVLVFIGCTIVYNAFVKRFAQMIPVVGQYA